MNFLLNKQGYVKKSMLALLFFVLVFAVSSSALVQISSIVFIIFCLILGLYQFVTKNNFFFDIRKTGLEKFILIFFISAFISNIFIDASFSMKLRNLYDFTWILLFYSSIFFIDRINRGQLEKLIQIFIHISIILALFSITQYIFGTNLIRENYTYGGIGRVTGFIGNPIPHGNTLAILTSFLLPFLFQQSKKVLKALTTITIYLLMVSLLFTYTRGAWIGAFFGAITVLYFFASKKNFLIYACLIISLLLPLLFLDQNIKVRAKNTGADYSSSQRIQLWNIYYDVIKENPVFGVGLFPRHKSFPELHKKYNLEPKTSSPHNNVLKMASSLGIIGFIPCVILFVAFLIFPLRAILYSEIDPFNRSILVGSIASQISFHFSGLTATNYLEMTTRTLLILILALSFSILHKPRV